MDGQRNLLPPRLEAALALLEVEHQPVLAERAADGLAQRCAFDADAVVPVERAPTILAWVDVEFERTVRYFGRALRERLASEDGPGADEHRQAVEARGLLDDLERRIGFDFAFHLEAGPIVKPAAARHAGVIFLRGLRLGARHDQQVPADSEGHRLI